MYARITAAFPIAITARRVAARGIMMVTTTIRMVVIIPVVMIMMGMTLVTIGVMISGASKCLHDLITAGQGGVNSINAKT